MSGRRPTYQRGDRGPDVAAIREALTAQGLLGSGGYDDSFDEACDRAVRAFQQTRGLMVDGLVGRQTWRALRGSRYSLGDRELSYQPAAMLYGDDVASLQERLLELGYDAGLRDAIFGPSTDRALRSFQRDFGMRGDGVCGTETLRSLRQLQRSVVGGKPHMMREVERILRRGPSLKGKRFMLDPAHGGETTGVVDHGITERDVMWDLAGRVAGLLSDLGADTFLTHAEVEDPDESERAAAANAAEADILISMHVDRNISTGGRGVAGFHYGTGSGVSSDVGEHLAGLLTREIAIRTGMPDLNIHPKTWDLLRMSKMPAVRLEIGYLTNEQDRGLLATEPGRQRIAEAIVIGIQRMYLPPERDRPTGTIDLTELRRSG